MEKAFATVLVFIQKFCGLFSDDEPYDPSWMDYTAWRQTRI